MQRNNWCGVFAGAGSMRLDKIGSLPTPSFLAFPDAKFEKALGGDAIYPFSKCGLQVPEGASFFSQYDESPRLLPA